MLSTLLITVPPMAGMWFNGVMGTSYGNNYFGGWNGGQPPPAGSGAGSGAHGSVNQNNGAQNLKPIPQNTLKRTVRTALTNSDSMSSGSYGAATQQTTALSQNNIANQQTRTNQQDLIVRHDSTPKNPTSKDRSE